MTNVDSPESEEALNHTPTTTVSGEAPVHEAYATVSRSLPAPITFTVGHHDIRPDVSVNYQLNRFSDGSAQMVAEMRGVAARIHDYHDYVRELTALSQQAFAHDRPLHGALYLRSAEFFMFPGDPAKQPARAQAVHQHDAGGVRSHRG